MSLQTNQIYVYSINVSELFTKKEKEISDKINCIKFYDDNVKNYIKSIDNTKDDEQIKLLHNKLDTLNHTYQLIKNEYNHVNDEQVINELKKELKTQIKLFDGVRQLQKSSLKENYKIAQFESAFTRALNVKTNETTESFIVLEVTYYDILHQVLKDGFTYDDKKYEFAFSSAGQIREKKIICVESSVYESIKGKLFAGLTDEKINVKGGLVVNKLTAYKALCNSATIPWQDVFGKKLNIDEVVVIPDFEHVIDEKVDHLHIDNDYSITPINGSVTNPVMDGAGVILPSYFEKPSQAKNMQFRSVFMKGLLIPFDWVEFAKSNGINLKSFKVKDVWGTEQSLRGVKIILTASQFKMWKFYDSWDEFKMQYKQYDCEFGIVDIESNNKKDFKDATLSYQMLQTLYKASDSQIKDITSYTRDKINELIYAAKDTIVVDDKKIPKSKKQQNKDAQLLLGYAGAHIKHKRPIHKALNLTDELLKDQYIKSKIADVRDSLIDDAKAGKIIMQGSRNCFILPDIIGFGQWLFGLDITGGLEAEEVSCKLFDNDVEVDMLRSPHLYIEHVIVTNKIKEQYKKYYTTCGIYTSINSTSSLVLAYDVDGDRATCIPNIKEFKSSHAYVEAAKAHLKDGKAEVLTYEMSKGTPVEINYTNTHESLTKAFSANIGKISNKMTKVFNKNGEITELDMDNLRLLKFINNQEIDYCKTLFRVPVKNKEIKKRLSSIDTYSFTNDDGEKTQVNIKLPYFFIKAKNKTNNQVEPCNKSTMNRIYELFDKANFDRLTFSRDKFDCSLLMSNPDVELNVEICERYDRLIDTYAKQVQAQIKKQNKGKKSYAKVSKVDEFYNKLMDGYEDTSYVVDVVIKYLYETKRSRNMFLLWESDIGEILLHNLEQNLLIRGQAVKCLGCEEVINRGSNNKRIRCDECDTVHKRQQDAIDKAKKRKSEMSDFVKIA